MSLLEVQYKFENSIIPKGKWRQCNPQRKVAGTFYRKRNAMNFIHGAIYSDENNLKYGIIVEKEPNNKYDKNALKLIGCWHKKRLFSSPVPRCKHIGYVPRGLAEFVSTLPPETPLAAELKYAKVKNKNNRFGDVFIDIYFVLLLPGLLSGFWDGRGHPF